MSELILLGIGIFMGFLIGFIAGILFNARIHG